jgi:hypothetical protein
MKMQEITQRSLYSIVGRALSPAHRCRWELRLVSHIAEPLPPIRNLVQDLRPTKQAAASVGSVPILAIPDHPPSQTLVLVSIV